MRSFFTKELWCHLSLNGGLRYTNTDIRKSVPLRVAHFRDLVTSVARIASHNPDYVLYFRGQAKDYMTGSGMSSVYPSIYRSPHPLSQKDLEKRFQILDSCSQQLVNSLKSLKIDNIHKIKKFPELQWSILQHYDVCDTPLLDVTHSLRVAASFALMKAADKALIFVFALPYPNGTISFSSEEEMSIVRLLSACPSQALRPHFQEGFLVGTFPSRIYKKHTSLDFGARLVGKIEIPKVNFWINGFTGIPQNALYPANDKLNEICSSIRSNIRTRM